MTSAVSFEIPEKGEHGDELVVDHRRIGKIAGELDQIVGEARHEPGGRLVEELVGFVDVGSVIGEVGAGVGRCGLKEGRLDPRKEIVGEVLGPSPL